MLRDLARYPRSNRIRARTTSTRRGSLLRIAGERMILLSQNGRLTLASATPKRFEVITTLADFVEGRQVWATPPIHNGKLYVKGEKEMVCVKIVP